MTALFLSEVRRDLSRRLVWVLVLVGVFGCMLAGGIAFANAKGSAGRQSAVQCEATPSGVTVCTQAGGAAPPDEFRLTELWPRDSDEGPLLAVPVVFLAIGGLFAGASMIGAEWRAGTVTTLLTWEPRRVRVAVAKLAAAGLLAFVISVALLAVFSLAMLPAGLRGDNTGTDAAWFGGLVAGGLRGGLLVALAAVFGAGVAMVGRNTAAALGLAFAYLMVGENIVRAWKPWLTRWLIGENSAVILLGEAPDAAPFRRGFGMALATMVLYVGVVGVAAVASFRARDIAAT